MVTPAEVCKIRMQAQFHSLLDPQEMARRKYRNVLQTAAVVAREEGVGALYKGLAPTVLRQGCNQVHTRGIRKKGKTFEADEGQHVCSLFGCRVGGCCFVHRSNRFCRSPQS